MDVLFCEEILFKVKPVEVARCRIALSQEEVLRKLMEHVGIELIDYGAFTIQHLMLPAPRHLEQWNRVSVFSKAYRERVERDAMAGR